MFAIQRKTDKLLMPGFKGHAGGTYVEPDDATRNSGIPRLFTSKKGATEALRWWSKGYVKKEMSGGGFDSLDGPEMTGLYSTPVEGRNMADWEIVSVKITTEET